jgi:hypothetical protein
MIFRHSLPVGTQNSCSGETSARGGGAASKSSISSNCRDKILQIDLRVKKNIDGSYLVILYRCYIHVGKSRKDGKGRKTERLEGQIGLEVIPRR